MMEINGLSKKHKVLKELSERSDLFRKLKNCLKFVAIVAADFLLSYFEHNVLGWLDYLDSYSLPDIFTVYVFLLIGNAVVAAVAWAAYINIRYIFIPYACTNIREMRAIRNYCYIPLTEEEVLQKGFKNAREYFSYVCHLLEYTDTIVPDGGLIFGERNHKWKKKAYLTLKEEDLRKMLLTCIALFENDGTLFDLSIEDCLMCPESFMNFISVKLIDVGLHGRLHGRYVKITKSGEVEIGYYWIDNGENKTKREILI